MVRTAVEIDDRPSAFRYPRGEGVGVDMPERGEPLEIGKGRVLREGTKIAILSLGGRLTEALSAAETLDARGLSTTVADARFAKPLDEDLIVRLARNHEALILLEEGAMGGFGAHVLTLLSDRGMLDTGLRVRSLRLPDTFIDQDSPASNDPRGRTGRRVDHRHRAGSAGLRRGGGFGRTGCRPHLTLEIARQSPWFRRISTAQPRPERDKRRRPMRSLTWIILGAALALPVTAQAKTIKAKGAAAAGVCSAALDLAAGMRAKAGDAQPAELVNMGNARDFFAELPMYDRNEITQNAQAFVRLMGQRMQAATSDVERQAIVKEIGDLAKGCFDSASKYAVAPPQAGQQPGTAIQPQPLNPQPLPAQPMPTQPLETQPLILNPVPQ